MIKKITLLVPVLLFLHLILLFFVRFTAWPEMTLWPYLMLNGWKPYTDIAIAHAPLMLFDLTIFYKIFGLGVAQLKLYTWIYILLTDFVLYWVVKKLFNKSKALVALVFFIVLSVIFQVNGLWFDLALMPLGLLIYYLLKNKNYLWVGITWTVAFFTKQTAIWFLVPMAVYIWLEGKKNLKKMWAMADYMLLGFLGTTLLVLLILAALKVIPSFLEWAISFGIFYLPKAIGQVSLPSVMQFILAAFPFGILIPYLWFYKKKVDWVLVSFCVFSALGVYPRWELFHFLPALPFLAIIYSEVFGYLPLKDKRPYKGIILMFALGVFLLFFRHLSNNWTMEVRFFEPSVQELATNIKLEAKENTIFVLNSWDSIYVYSQTLPVVKPWLPYLPWYLEYQNNKDEILAQLKAISPQMIIVGKFTTEGLGSYQQPDLIDYITRYYSLQKVVGETGIYIKNQ